MATKSRKLGPRFDRALLFAKRKHEGQARKGTSTPYVAHLLGVAALVLEAGGDEDMAIAALLHDVVEDCGGPPMLREVRKRFGPRVANMVEGCTDAFVEPKPPWRERKEKYLQNLSKKDADTHVVSAADKVYNARAILLDYHEIGEAVWQRFSGKKDGTLWYYRELAKEFNRANVNRLGPELARVIAELERISMPGKRPSLRRPNKTARSGTQR